MSKYLELFTGSFNESIVEKTKPENKPYVAYSIKAGKVAYTVLPREIKPNEFWYKTSDGNKMEYKYYYMVEGTGVPVYDYIKVPELGDMIGNYKVVSHELDSQTGYYIMSFDKNLTTLPSWERHFGGLGGDEIPQGFEIESHIPTKLFSEIIISQSIEYIKKYHDHADRHETVYNEGVITDFINYDTCEKISISKNNKLLDSRDNSNSIIETETDTLLFACKNTTIPVSVKHIGDSIFVNSHLKTIDIPSGILSIGSGCYSENQLFITDCITLPETIEYIGSNAFSNRLIVKADFINNSSLDAEINSYWGAIVADHKSEEGLYYNDTITVKYAGENNTTINIPEGVTVIDTNTFGESGGSYSYLTINLPSTITTLKECSIGGIEFITVNYNGTKEQWNSITKESEWSAYSCAGDYDNFWDDPYFIIHCTDGDVTVNGRWWA